LLIVSAWLLVLYRLFCRLFVYEKRRIVYLTIFNYKNTPFEVLLGPFFIGLCLTGVKKGINAFLLEK
jgi:hypothetical protein